ncbi:DNA-binding protein [Aeromonas sp. 1HA1]|uniref:DNA-binding protein n=1 Tax=Aeromonas sp. 1HA1 TaxID=2699193 RepID=UPI0023DDCD82|nr:DNA-binding protein [Aeromonas sp. 1HA1]MDF2415414.1 DNA-binding protein [Aeromonas sp. 1HA1]
MNVVPISHSKAVLSTIPSDIRNMPECYPFGEMVYASLEQWADMSKQTLKAVRHQADRGDLPIKQARRGAKRYVKLMTIYMDERYSAMRYLAREH